ncbi:MAG: hypothetical protein E7168_01125 [Firmicutes bacterium]|nr:hypothetical protein [Bacillota bacterium]
MSDITSIDYYCKNCRKIKTFLQGEYQNYILITDFYNTLEGFASYYIKEDSKDSLEYTIYLDDENSFKDKTDNNITDITMKQKIKEGSCTHIFKKFYCPKCKNSITMIFLFKDNYIEKIYQSYTSVLLNDEEIKKYEKSKLLDKLDKEYLINANKSRNSGLNIGSFIYLRRVLENMLNRIYKKNINNIIILENEDFYTMKTSKKVKYLNEFLPNLISGEHNKGKYSDVFKLISEVVHNFSEEQCYTLYELLENIIILILNKELEDKFEKETIESFNRNYNLIFKDKKDKSKKQTIKN